MLVELDTPIQPTVQPAVPPVSAPPSGLEELVAAQQAQLHAAATTIAAAARAWLACMRLQNLCQAATTIAAIRRAMIMRRAVQQRLRLAASRRRIAEYRRKYGSDGAGPRTGYVPPRLRRPQRSPPRTGYVPPHLRAPIPPPQPPEPPKAGPRRGLRVPALRDVAFLSDEAFDDPRAPCELEACDAEGRRAGFEAGYDHGYHRGSRPAYDCDDDDRYDGYEDGYQAGYDAVHRDESDGDPESHCEESLAWWEDYYAEMDEREV